MKKCLQMVMGILVGCMITLIACWVYETVRTGVDGEPQTGAQDYVQVEGEALDTSGAGELSEDGSAEISADKEESGEAATGKEESGATESSGSMEDSAGAGSAKTEGTAVTITISAAGDCSLGNHQEQDYNGSFVQAYDLAEDAGYFFANVKDIFSEDDFTIVNLEGVFTTSDNADTSRTYNIKGDPSYAGILTAGDVEAVSMANNHRLDFGTEGTKDTVAALETEGILYAYDDIVCISEVKGIRIGYVSVNEVAWGKGTEKLVQDGIDKLKAEDVDLIIACCHWGIEKEYFPESYQQELGRKCIDMGADLVLGHHPHVLQGIEEYNGKYIVYSLGNFSFGANRNPADKDTMIFRQTFTFVDGQLQEDLDAEVIPCSLSSVSNRNNFQPTPLSGEEAQRVIGRLNEFSAGMGVVIGEDGRLVPEI